MKNVILYIFLLFIAFSLVKCGHFFYSGMKNFPDYASEEVLSKQYQKLISEIDQQIANSGSALSLGANLETIDYPSNTIYVAIAKEDDKDDILVYGKMSNSKTTFSINNYGYGTIGSKKMVLIYRPIDKYNLDQVEVFLEHKE